MSDINGDVKLPSTSRSSHAHFVSLTSVAKIELAWTFDPIIRIIFHGFAQAGNVFKFQTIPGQDQRTDWIADKYMYMCMVHIIWVLWFSLHDANRWLILGVRNLEFFIIHNCDMNYECNQWKRELTLSNVFRNGYTVYTVLQAQFFNLDSVDLQAEKFCASLDYMI